MLCSSIILMALREYTPRELTPESRIPDPEILRAFNRECGMSDLFPEHYTDLDGPLGNYLGGEPPVESPLALVADGLRGCRYRTYGKEEANDWVRTDETSRELMGYSLQATLADRIDQSFRNLVAGGESEEEAVKIIAGYIDDKHALVTEGYEFQLDVLTAALAAAERGDAPPQPEELKYPVIKLDMILAGTAPSDEVQRQARRDFLSDQIALTKRRKERLDFEWLTAASLLQVLREAA